MAEQKNWYLVFYDIFDDVRLKAVRKVMTAWGHPVQYSVFRIRGTSRVLERMRFELAEVMAPDDRLMIVRPCPHCSKTVMVRGKELSPFTVDPPPFHIL